MLSGQLTKPNLGHSKAPIVSKAKLTGDRGRFLNAITG